MAGEVVYSYSIDLRRSVLSSNIVSSVEFVGKSMWHVSYVQCFFNKFAVLLSFCLA